jgi:hypothetical protein
MLNDYAEAVRNSNQASVSYLMLIGEAARLSNLPDHAAAAFHLVIRTREAPSGEHLLRFIEHLEPYLTGNSKVTTEDTAELARIRGRFARSVNPKDF